MTEATRDRIAPAHDAEVRLADGRISESLIEEMRAKAGTEMRIGASTNNSEATWHAIVRFAEAVGDTNPLWTDAEYAAASPYGRLVAPPSWVICCFSGLQFGWPGLGAFHCRSAMTFHLPVRLGDTITPTCTYLGFDGPKRSSFAGEMIIDHFANEYTNQDSMLVARIEWDVIRYERSNARKLKRLSGVELPHPWEPDELATIEESILAETARGAKPRCWDDVAVGDTLPIVTKGPIGIADEVAFVAAGGMPIPRMAAHRAALLNYQRHPKWAFRDPVTRALEPVFAVHYNVEAARAMGVPAMYDAGYQRQTWAIHLLTNWIGDDAWLKFVEGEYRSFVYLSDVVTLGGEVVEKYVDADGEHVVKIQTWARNQRGDNVMPGSAVVALPARGRSETHPARRRCTLSSSAAHQ